MATAVSQTLVKVKQGFKDVADELDAECNPFNSTLFKKEKDESSPPFSFRSLIHIPYFPAFHQPGWMLRYVLGPYDEEWAEMLFDDLQAGITVLITLIPQGLSQAAIANLPPIYGLYTSIIPTATYAFFGSSMQLTVGPTALISLMTGAIINKYGLDAETDLEEVVDTAAQAAFCVGIIISVLGIFNMGNLINFMSHPVMAGFTTGAALTIGVTQMTAAFGFIKKPPQVGADHVHHNYEVLEWWAHHFNDKDNEGHQMRNHYAVKICFGIYVPLMIVQLIKWNYKPSKETKKTWAYRIWHLFTSLLPLLAIIISAAVAYNIKKSDHFNDPDYVHSFYAENLKIVGEIPKGLDILRIPTFRHPMGTFLIDIFPITLIAFMESYSIARNIGAMTNSLHTLNASQEMVANGIANLLGSVSSSYPVSGSFSRSALNASCGARTPLSICVCILGVVICLSVMAETLKFVPQAVLAAIIFVAIANLIHFKDFWHAWKHSKKDFFTMTMTMLGCFLFETSIGLAVGIVCSILVYCVFDTIFAKSHAPRLFSSSKEGPDGGMVDVVRIESDLNFLTSARIKDFITALAIESPKPPTVDNKSAYYRFKIASGFDYVLRPHLLAGVDTLPTAIVIDMCIVKTVDLSGMEALESAMNEVRAKGVKVALINLSPEIDRIMADFGVHSDKSTESISFERYEELYRMDLWSIAAARIRKTSADLTYEEGGLDPASCHSVERGGIKGDTFAETDIPTVAQKSDKHHQHLYNAEVANASEKDFDGIELGGVGIRARTGSASSIRSGSGGVRSRTSSEN